jgi:DNA-binding SARP family transcriptional activator
MITCRTLGPVAVTADGAPPPAELLWRKHLALLVYLARSPRRTRSRDHLTGLLWGDRPEAAARHSLREAIRVLRRCVGEEALEATAEHVRLAGDAVVLDVDLLEEHVAAERWEEAAAQVSGEFLEGFGVPDATGFEDWLAAERLHWRTRCVEVLSRCSSVAARRGQLEHAAECGRRALGLGPASGPAVRATMTALALAGDREGALALYETFTRHLAAEIGTEPDAPTRALADRVRSERTWALAEAQAAPRRGAESRRAPLAGRERELGLVLAEWERCGRDGHATLALVEGESGVGKTRLAEEVVARARLDGAAVSAVRAVPGDAHEPLAGLLGLARGGLVDAPGVGGAAPEALAAFAARATEWAERFPGARGADQLPLTAAFVETVRAATEGRPLLLFLDDAHRLDAATLEAVGTLLRDLAGAPIFVLLTAATEAPREALDELRVRLGRDVPGVAVRLAPLTAAALQALARWAFPSYSDVEIDRVARRVATDSAGLPLLAVELYHAVALGLDLHRTAGAWPAEHHTLDQSLPGDLPDAVVAAIRIGFRRLSRDAQAVLAAASVLDERVAPAVLGRASGVEGERLRRALDEAEWQRWLASDARGYSFVARIVRNCIAREMLTEGQRRRVLDAATAPGSA